MPPFDEFADRDGARRRKIFRCFRSPMHVQGEILYIDSKISAKRKRQAVYRGFENESGRRRKDLSPLEWMVIRMRDATTGESFDHEWWAEWISTPQWFRNLHDVLLETWLFYPRDGSRIDARELGEKIGYEFEYQRRKFERAISDPVFIEEWRSACGFDPEEPLELPAGCPPEWKDEKVVHRFLVDGFDDWERYSRWSLRKLRKLRAKIFALQGQLGEELTPFSQGLARGTSGARKVDLDDDLFGAEERDQILRILENDFERIAQFRNRREIADHIISQLPARRQQLFKDLAQRNAFVERLRNTYFGKIGLKPAAKGRPAKWGKSKPHRSRIILYTPDPPSGREDSTSS